VTGPSQSPAGFFFFGFWRQQFKANYFVALLSNYKTKKKHKNGGKGKFREGSTSPFLNSYFWPPPAQWNPETLHPTRIARERVVAERSATQRPASGWPVWLSGSRRGEKALGEETEQNQLCHHQPHGHRRWLAFTPAIWRVAEGAARAKGQGGEVRQWQLAQVWNPNPIKSAVITH